MKTKLTCLSVSLLLLLASCSEKKQAPGQAPGQAALTVGAIVIEPGELEERIQVTGTILANEEVDIRSEISGRVTAINFREDSRVGKGDLLVRINDSELQAQLKKLELEKKLAEDDVYRKTRLLEMNAVSKEEYDIAVNQLGIIEAEIDLVRSQIAKSSIVAPFSGKVGLRMISPGAYVSPATLFTHLQDCDPVRIEFAGQEKYLGKVGKNIMVQFRVEGIDSLFSGLVYAVDPRIDLATRTFMVRASCPNPSYLLIPGAFARVEVFLETVPDALMIPSECIMPDIRGERVFILENGRAKGVYIKSGTRTDREVQVTRGLHPKDTVITTGLLQIRENMPLQVMIEDNPSLN